MSFTGEIMLGNIAIIVTLVGIAIGFGQQLGSFRTTLLVHANSIDKHTLRLDRHDDKILELITGVQRLIGVQELSDQRAQLLEDRRQEWDTQREAKRDERRKNPRG